MSYLITFLGFALLIILHEAGHFAAAKAVGMRVERFSLFFGRMVLKRRIGETEYGVGVIPLGGYVKITGMSSGEIFETPEIEARAYVNQPVWKRIVVITAGPAVNLVIAFVLLWAFFLGTHRHLVTNRQGSPIATRTIAVVERGSAAQGVLRAGDKIVSINGVSGSPQQMAAQIKKQSCAGGAHVNGCRATQPVTIVVRRHGALKTLHVRPRWNAADKRMLAGFGWTARTAPNGVLYSAGRSVDGLWQVTARTVSDIAQIFKPKARQQLHSIVGATAIASQDISAGWTSGVEIMALISLSLGIINLFPFLPLDGGHIFWALAEKIRGRKVPLPVMERASFVGIALIAILLVIGLSNDISSLTGNGFSQ